MHGQSYTFYRLAVHLTGEQNVYYQEGQRLQVTSQAQRCYTHLTAWFRLNNLYAAAREFKYCKIPFHDVFNRKDSEDVFSKPRTNRKFSSMTAAACSQGQFF